MTLALVKSQMAMAEAKPITGRIDKWKVFRDICEARERFGLQDRALAVLDALLTFHPEGELDADRPLVVFPSNGQLSVRAHGIAGTTLRRQLAALVDAGLIQRRDSPNGKRYAHRGNDGAIEQAFGFDLQPLVVRAADIALMAQAEAAEKLRLRRLREALTICRRDVRKLISAAVEEGAPGNWEQVEAVYVGIIARLPRRAAAPEVTEVLEEMEMLRTEILNRLQDQLNSSKMGGNDHQHGAHIQNSNTDPIDELEPRSEKEQGERPEPDVGEAEGKIEENGAHPPRLIETKARKADGALQVFPLALVLRACPTIADYGPGGELANWRALMGAAVVVRSMLGVSPSAYQEACEVMGPENAATAIACILERAGQINSAGGYLRDLTRRAKRGEFGLGPMLMSLIRHNAGPGRQLA